MSTSQAPMTKPFASNVYAWYINWKNSYIINEGPMPIHVGWMALCQWMIFFVLLVVTICDCCFNATSFLLWIMCFAICPRWLKGFPNHNVSIIIKELAWIHKYLLVNFSSLYEQLFNIWESQYSRLKLDGR
jgi:hypothetical protein